MLSNILKTNNYKKKEMNLMGIWTPHDIFLFLEYSKGFPCCERQSQWRNCEEEEWLRPCVSTSPILKLSFMDKAWMDQNVSWKSARFHMRGLYSFTMERNPLAMTHNLIPKTKLHMVTCGWQKLSHQLLSISIAKCLAQ